MLDKVLNEFDKLLEGPSLTRLSKLAVIVTGNPKYIKTTKAKKFYIEIEKLLTQSGYIVSYDSGNPNTIPDENAALWIAHSRGLSRLDYAPSGIKLLGIGGDQSKHKFKIINNPKDNYSSEGKPNNAHFELTPEMSRTITKVARGNPIMINEGGNYKTQQYSDETGLYNVLDIINYVEKNHKVEQIPIMSLVDNNLKQSPGDAPEDIPGHPKFVARAKKSDLSYPIVVVRYEEDGLWIVDGVHRLYKAKNLQRMRTISGYIMSNKELKNIKHT